MRVKIISGDVETDPVSFFKFSTNCITWGHKYKLLKQSLRVDACKFRFANRVLTAWNNLPASVGLFDVLNLNNFKTCLHAVNLRRCLCLNTYVMLLSQIVEFM